MKIKESVMTNALLATRPGLRRILRQIATAGFSLGLLGSSDFALAQTRTLAQASGSIRPASPRIGELRRSADGLVLYRWSGRGWMAVQQTRRLPVAPAVRASNAQTLAALQALRDRLLQAASANQRATQSSTAQYGAGIIGGGGLYNGVPRTATPNAGWAVIGGASRDTLMETLNRQIERGSTEAQTNATGTLLAPSYCTSSNPIRGDTRCPENLRR
jgi:hypothetical protein